MTPHNKSSSYDVEKVRIQMDQQSKERPRSSSSDAKLPSVEGTPKDDLNHTAAPSYGLVRCKSDTSSNKSIYNSTTSRQLRTITSGIALDEMKSPTQSLPPLSPSKGYHSPQCPYYGSPMAFRKSLPNDKDLASQPQYRKSPPQALQKCSQMQGQQLPPIIPNVNSEEQEQYTLVTHRSTNSHSSFDPKQGTFMQQLRANDQRGDNDSDSAVGSQVDSIVFHYTPGMEVPPAEYALPASILKVYGVDCECMGAVDKPGRMTSSLTNSGSDYEENCQHETDEPIEPPVHHMISSRYELLPPDSQYHSYIDEFSYQQILPYHERKRLTEIKEKEEKKNARKESKLAAKSRATKTENNALNNKRLASYDYEHNKPPGFKLFGRLTALITGEQGDKTPNQEHKHYGSIEDETREYRDKGNAFIQKTQKERIKYREQCKSDELNNVTIPISTLHGPGHSRAKMSSLSNALDSIADCSTDEDSCSSDEETGSSYYDSDCYSNTTESTRKVWKQGDPSITSKKASKRDRLMERERLLQEEYEFKLRRLTKENELLAKKFRLFVLVTVAFILLAALSFALMLCIKMLLLA